MSYFFPDAFKTQLAAAPTMMAGARLHLVLFAHAPDDLGGSTRWASAVTLADLLALPGWFEVSGIGGYPTLRKTAPISVQNAPNATTGPNHYVLWESYPFTELLNPVTVEAIGVFLVAGTDPGPSDKLVMVTDSFIRGHTNLYPGDLINANPDPSLTGSSKWLFSWVDGTTVDPVEGALSIYRDAPPFEVSNTQHVWMYPQRVNLVANPSFERDTGLWVSNGVITRVAGPPTEYPSNNAWAGSSSGAGGLCVFESNTFPTQLADNNTEQWTIQLRAKGVGKCKVALIYWDAGANITSSDWGTETWTLNPDTWLHLAVHRTAPEAHLAMVRVECQGTLLAIDQVLCEHGYLKDWWYFDGDETYGARDDFSWYGGSGRRGASYSLWYNNRRDVIGRLFAKDVEFTSQTSDDIYFPAVPAVGGYIDCAGGTASTPDDPALTITTDVVITAKVRKTLIDNANRTQIANQRSGTATTDLAWEFRMQTGQLFFKVSTDGVGFTVVGVLGDLRGLVGDGQDFYIGAAFTRNVGGGGTTHSVTGLYSLDGVTWGSLLTSGAGGAISALFNSTSPVRIGAQGTSTSLWDGRVYWVEMRTGLVPGLGTRLFRFDGDDWTSGTTFVSGARPWTVTNAAAMSAHQPGIPAHSEPGPRAPTAVDTDIESQGLVYRWVPAGVSVTPHLDVLFPNDLQNPVTPPKSTITPYAAAGADGVINPWV